MPWFGTEQPSDAVKACVEAQLEWADWQMDYVLSHTALNFYEPTHPFIPGLNQSLIGKTTEEWQDSIEKRLT